MPWAKVILTEYHEAFVDTDTLANAETDYTDLSFKNVSGHVDAEWVSPADVEKHQLGVSEYPVDDPQDPG